MFRYLRLISVLLILVIATSPVLAANCVTSCVTKSMLITVNSAEMSNMPNCHMGSIKKEHSSPNVDYKSCPMGVGCNYSQATPVDFLTKLTLNNSTSISFSNFNSSEKSADLLPPIKPPA